MTVRWTEAAVRDLEELHAFVAADRPETTLSIILQHNTDARDR
jgi:hypothetical protein